MVLLKQLQSHHHPADTGRKLNVHKTFRRRPGRLLNVLCTFNLPPVSTGQLQDPLDDGANDVDDDDDDDDSETNIHYILHCPRFFKYENDALQQTPEYS